MSRLKTINTFRNHNFISSHSGQNLTTRWCQIILTHNYVLTTTSTEENIVVVVMFCERKEAFTRKKKNQLNILL